MMKFKHFRVNPTLQFTLCTYWNSEKNLLSIGYSVFNPNDPYFIKKKGNEIAKERCIREPLSIEIPGVVTHYFITWTALTLMEKDFLTSDKYGISLDVKHDFYDWMNKYIADMFLIEKKRNEKRLLDYFLQHEETVIRKIFDMPRKENLIKVAEEEIV